VMISELNLLDYPNIFTRTLPQFSIHSTSMDITSTPSAIRGRPNRFVQSLAFCKRTLYCVPPWGRSQN
jgi:hypothetical protein